MQFRRLLIWVALLASAFLPPAGAASARTSGTAVHSAAPLPLHCRGSTRARVRIHWPSAADRAANRRLNWGAHVPHLLRRWAYLIVPTASANGVDPYLVAGVMEIESSGDPLAWNLDSDAHGLMQVLHAPFEPATNIRLGVSMLASLQRQFGSRDLALAAYNAGPGNVRYYGGIPPFTETRDYVILVGYYRDLYAGARITPARTAGFKATWADLKAYYRRICGRA